MTTGYYYARKSKFFVDAAFVPNHPESAIRTHPSYLPCPTFVLQVAYRFQNLSDFRKEVEIKTFSHNLSIQLVLGIKIFDDDLFSVILLRRTDRNRCDVLQQVNMISTKVKTDEIFSLPADALLWGDNVSKASKDCELKLESLRYVFNSPGRCKILR